MARKRRAPGILQFGIRGDNLNAALSGGELVLDEGHIRWAELRDALSKALLDHPEAAAAIVLRIENDFGLSPGSKIST